MSKHKADKKQDEAKTDDVKSEEATSMEVFTLELPVSPEDLSTRAAGDPWNIASRLYRAAQSQLGELVATKLPSKEAVLKGAEEAYDKYVKMVEDIGREGFLSSIGALYDGLVGIVKS